MTQWAIFLNAAFIGACIALLPGYIVLRGIGFKRSASLCIAAPCSVFAISSVGLVLARIGISAAAPLFLTLTLLACLALALLGFVVRMLLFRGRSLRFEFSVNRNTLVVSVVFALIVYAVVFVAPLNGPSSFVQHSDAMSHLGFVKNMIHTGRYSCLEVTQYPEMSNLGASPFSGRGGFYPAAFHILAALVAQLVNVSASLSINAMNVVFGAVVYPLGSMLLFHTVLPNRRIAVAQALLPLSCVAFPFAMYTFGPLYSNAASMACFPATASLFILLVDGLITRRGSARVLVAFLVSIMSLVFLQPNTVFSLAVLLAPYCVVRAGDFYQQNAGAGISDDIRRKRTILVRCVAVFVILLIWTMLLLSPATRGVVSFNWAPIFSKTEALASLVTFRLRFGVAQPFYSVIVLVGIVELVVRHREGSWLVGSLALSMTIYFVDCTVSGPVQAFFSGFWYSDQWRTAALVGVISIPVAAYGVLGMKRIVENVTNASRYGNTNKVGVSDMLVATTNGLIVLILVFLPSFQHLDQQYPSAFIGIGDTLTRMNDLRNDDNSYTDSERRFVQRVIEEIGTDELVLNMPTDGSCAAYMDLGVNVYYKGLSTSGDSANAQVLRSSLCNYTVDPAAEEALRSTGARYVLKLGLNGFQDHGESMWSLNGSYSADQWKGFLGISDSTPGFTLVLSEGDYRLYRIDL